MQTKKIDKINN